MALPRAGSKQKRSRKARTDVSSPSSSEMETKTSEPKESDKKMDESTNTIDSASDAAHGADEVGLDSQPVFSKRNLDPEKAFEEFYLRQATKEFANDLDKLRTASDFRDRSVPMLVEALKQGTTCFSSDEKMRIVKYASSSG